MWTKRYEKLLIKGMYYQHIPYINKKRKDRLKKLHTTKKIKNEFLYKSLLYLKNNLIE